jgi:hypothetical protein
MGFYCAASDTFELAMHQTSVTSASYWCVHI